MRTYGIDDDAREGQAIREGFDPSKIQAQHPPPEHAVSEDEIDDDAPTADSDKAKGSRSDGPGRYGSLMEEDNVWDRS